MKLATYKDDLADLTRVCSSIHKIEERPEDANLSGEMVHSYVIFLFDTIRFPTYLRIYLPKHLAWMYHHGNMDVLCRGKLPKLSNGLILHGVAIMDLVVGAHHELQVVHDHVLNVVNIGCVGHSLGMEEGEREEGRGREGLTWAR